MKNIDQIRAKNALDAGKTIGGGVNDGEVVKKVPSYIINNGLLAAAAFAMETKKGYEKVFEAIVVHLQSIHKVPDNIEPSSESLIRHLVKEKSAVLRDVTAEAMAYLNYLRRFANCSEKEK